MSADYFLDTNILVYSFDKSVPEKMERAQSLISDAIEGRRGIISWQVVQEFLNVARHKFENPMGLEDAVSYFRSVLQPLCTIHSDNEIFQLALSAQLETGYGFYDALIVAAAIKGKCAILFSEDLQDGREIRNTKIVNPFD